MVIKRGDYETCAKYYSKLIKERGYSPRKIMELEGTLPNTIYNHFNKAIDKGLISRHELLFSIPKKTRAILDSCIKNKNSTDFYQIQKALNIKDKSTEKLELMIYLAHRDAQVELGIMYEDIRFIETRIHSSLVNFLKNKFGEDDKGWWRKGIPTSLRKKLQIKFQEDDKPASHAIFYTNLIDLSSIIDHNWKLLNDMLPKKIKSNKKLLFSNINRLNQIRNYIMHPVKGIIPKEDDFRFVKDFMKSLELDKWS